MSLHPIYTPTYFINKFSKIPSNKWCVNEFENSNGKCCSLGHCGVNQSNYYSETNESKNLRKLLKEGVVSINDKLIPKYQQKTPKKRIIAALRDKQKELEPVKYQKWLNSKKRKVKRYVPISKEFNNDRIVYITIDKQVKKLTKELQLN